MHQCGGTNFEFAVGAEMLWLLKIAFTVFVCRQIFRKQACEVNGSPSVVCLKSECFELRKTCSHPPFFGRRINREPDALLARHIGRPRQPHLAGVVSEKTVNGAHAVGLEIQRDSGKLNSTTSPTARKLSSPARWASKPMPGAVGFRSRRRHQGLEKTAGP